MLADKQLNAGQGIWLMTSTAAALAPHFPDLSFPPSFQVCHCQVPSQTYLHQKSAPFCQPEDSTKLKKLLLLSEIWHLSRHFFLFEDSSCTDSSSSSSGSSAQFLIETAATSPFFHFLFLSTSNANVFRVKCAINQALILSAKIELLMYHILS